MFVTSCIRKCLQPTNQFTELSRPKFFLILQNPSRTFTSTPSTNSKIGKTAIMLPPSVTLTIVPPEPPKIKTRDEPLRKVRIDGPLGTLSHDLPSYLNLTIDLTARKASVSVEDARDRKQREMWGTTRALIQSHVLGVSEGHTAILRLNGVGYRAVMEQNGKVVSLKVGFSHPVELPVPDGVTASTPQPTRILLEGTNKMSVNDFAADIRKWRPPEPYKGKGIFVNGETIKLKAKKVK